MSDAIVQTENEKFVLLSLFNQKFLVFLSWLSDNVWTGKICWVNNFVISKFWWKISSFLRVKIEHSPIMSDDGSWEMPSREVVQNCMHIKSLLKKTTAEWRGRKRAKVLCRWTIFKVSKFFFFKYNTREW